MIARYGKTQTDRFTMRKQTSRMTASRIRPALVALACALCACLATVAVPAAATVIHNKEGSFNGSERPTLGAFSYFLPSVAVEESTGDVWVTESKIFGFYGNAFAVDKFNAKGEYAGVQLTGAGTPQNEFSFGAGFAAAIAVDNTASGPRRGDLYVSDTGNGVVDRFSDSGTFECQITGRAPSTAEEIAHECNGAAGSLTPDGSIEPAGLAVDSVGDLYVADHAHTAIDVFSPSGEYKRQIKDFHLGSLGTIALDSAGNLYVTNFNETIVEFDSSGNFAKIVNEGDEPVGVAVDPRSDNLYVGIDREPHGSAENEEASAEAIAEYNPSGALLDIFGSRLFTYQSESFSGLGVGPTGEVYAAEFFNLHGANVQIYSADIIVPTVTTEVATAVEENTATLQGHVDPDAVHGGGEVTSCQFEYGPTDAYGLTAPCTPGPSYSSPTDVSAAIAGLKPASTYHFRIEAANSNGIPSYGEDETLTTHGPPTVDYETVETLTSSAKFKAKVDPWGSDTSCQLQYVTDASFQESAWTHATTVPCSPQDLGSGFGDVTFKFTVTGLARETTYHYRFLASNHVGSSSGADQTFETFAITKFTVESFKSGHVNPSANGSGWEPGELDSQAGAHPYEVASTIEFSPTTVLSSYYNSNTQKSEETEFFNNTAPNVKDVNEPLPPGLIGNPSVTPKCNRYLVAAEECPPDTQIGVVEVWFDHADFRAPAVGSEEENRNRETPTEESLYNLEPAGNYPAQFGSFVEGNTGIWIDFHLRTGSDYGVTGGSLNVSSLGGPFWKVRVRTWGVPASAAHNSERRCRPGETSCPSDLPLRPLLRNPTSCVGPETFTATADTWGEQGQYVSKSTEMPGFTGCGKTQFGPGLEAAPTSSVADSPTGLHLDVHMPQPEGCKEEAGTTECELAEADLKDAQVTLPAGLAVDPSSADGLQACSESQIGYLPQQSAEAGRPQFTPAPAECPEASKIGTVEVDTPLLGHPLTGGAYVAQQGANPFKSLLALYIAIYDPQTGVVVKLPGKIAADPVTGQLTTTFDEDPQLPFGDFKVDLFPGGRAALTTPLTCGSYAASGDLTPWSAPEGENATPLSPPFTISGAPGGAACASSEAQAPNAPVFEAGTASPVAGSYSPFVLHLKREDASQHFGDLNVTLPPGLIGKIAGIEQCPQAAIEAAQARSHEGEGASEVAHPSCPAGSEVGVVHVGTGSGAPYYVAGHAYFAGPYKGAPFSLVIVTPAVAGPFDLGSVVVRAALYIDPHTAQVTVKSDSFPTILDGIPLDIRSVNVDMNRKEFTLNPTSCNVMSVTGQESSTAGQTAALSDRFQAGGCTNLPFQPSFAASTQGATSKADGASLTVKVVQPPGQANIAKVDLQLPKLLPSRLSTLQKACTAAQFEANPAGCPEASFIGTATAHTPILASPLTGPAILVSRGNAGWPDVEFVLQGENGVEIVLDGATQIKNEITYSKFETVPDAPISSFETTLPEGPHSVLGTDQTERATSSLCGQKLEMPTTITGQNGVVVNQVTKIALTGCSTVKTKPVTRARKLKVALKLCRSKFKGRGRRGRRVACEKAAQRQFGSHPKTKRAKKKK